MTRAGPASGMPSVVMGAFCWLVESGSNFVLLYSPRPSPCSVLFFGLCRQPGKERRAQGVIEGRFFFSMGDNSSHFA